MQRDKFIAVHDTITQTVRKALSYRTKDPHLIDDICQDVLIVCWKFERDHGAYPPEPFVVTVALNRYRTWGRNSWVRKRKPQESPLSSSNEDPAVTTEKAEQSMILLSMLNGLTALYREIMRLHIVEGWTVKRIARQRMVSESTVKRQYRRAKGFLEKAVKQHCLN